MARPGSACAPRIFITATIREWMVGTTMNREGPRVHTSFRRSPEIDMSIYATLGEIGIRRFGDCAMIEIMIQGVPPHIDYTGDAWAFLPPPVDPDGETMRAVFFVESGEPKGTERCGQEYIRPLLMLTGEEYKEIRFSDLIDRVEKALDRSYGPRPSVIVIDPEGNPRNIP
jgi:hypothetical protein